MRFFGGDAQRRWRAWRGLPRSQPRLRWRFDAGAPIAASPVVDARGGIYFGAIDGSFYRLDAGGKLTWKQRLPGPVFSTAALSSHCVLVGSDDEQLRCLTPASGALRWQRQLGPCSRLPGQGMDRVRCQADGSALWGDDQRAYLAVDALYAFEGSGRQVWRQPIKGHARASVALAGDRLIVGTQGHAIAAFARGDGSPLWRVAVRYHCDGTPAVDGERIYIGCDDGLLRALRVADGALLWSFQTRGELRSGVAVPVEGGALFGSYDGYLYRLSAAGKLLWKFKVGRQVQATPLVDAAGTLVVGARDGYLYGLAAADGRQLWRHRLGGEIDSSVALGADGTLLVGCDDGKLYGLR